MKQLLGSTILLTVLLCTVQYCPAQTLMGGLKVFIENAEKDDIIGATVRIMKGKSQVTGGVTDFTGFLYLSNIEAGRYQALIRHSYSGTDSLEIEIEENRISELRIQLKVPPRFKEKDSTSTKVSQGGLKLPGRGSRHVAPKKPLLKMPPRGPFNYPENNYATCWTPSFTKKPKKDSSGYDVVLTNTSGILHIQARDVAGKALFGTRVVIRSAEGDVDSTVTWAVVGADGYLRLKLLPGKYKVRVSHPSVGGLRVFPITIWANGTSNIRLQNVATANVYESVWITGNKQLAFVRPFQNTPIEQSSSFPEVAVLFR